MAKKAGLILSLLFLVMVTFLNACRSDGEAITATPEITSSPVTNPIVEPVEALATPVPLPNLTEDFYAPVNPASQVIVFWHPYMGEAEKALLEIVANFNASNPWGITVMAEFQGSYSDIFDKMLAFMNTADAPDLLMAFPEQAAAYQLNNALINMDELVYSSSWGMNPQEIADFYPGYFQKDVFPTFDQQRLGMPLSGSVQLLYYNQNWLSELGYPDPPTTLEEFREMACAAAVQPFSGATIEGNTGYQLKVDATNFVNWIFASGGYVFEDAVARYNYDNPAALNAMQFMQSLATEGCLTLVNEDRADRIAFGQGATLFTIGASTDFSQFQSEVDANAQFQWTVASLPTASSGPLLNISGPSVSIARSNPERQLAAWLFVKSFLDPIVQARWAQALGDFPVRASALSNLSVPPAFADASAWLTNGQAEPPVPGYDQVRDMAAEALFAITQGADVAGVLGQLTTDANTNLATQMAVTPKSSDPWVDVDPSGQTIIYWHQQAPNQHAVLAEIVSRFNNTNEWGITIVPEYQGTTDELYQKTLASLESGSVPGLVEAYQDQAATYQQSDMLFDLTGLVDSIKWGLSPEEKSDFFPGVFNQDIYPNFGNSRLGFPIQRSMQVLYYNMDWLAELKKAGSIDFDGPPVTPEQFQSAACAAVGNPFSKSVNGSGLGYQLNPDATTFSTWTFAFGGDVYDDQLALYSYNHPSAIAAADYLQDLIAQSCADQVRERFDDQTHFATGATLFMIGSSADLHLLQETISEEGAFEMGVTAIPHTTAEAVGNLSGISFSLLNASTPEAKVATWLFIKYFTSPEIQAQWAQATGYFPVRFAATGYLVDYLAANPEYATVYPLLPSGITEPSVPGYDSVRRMVSDAFDVIFAGERVEPILDQLNQDANRNLIEQPTP